MHSGPDTTVIEVAARVLRPRLEHVYELFPAAALRAEEDPEHVHQLRVATRRAVAACQLFEQVLPRRRVRRLVRLLRRIRRAAGRARDCDVILARWHRDAAAPASARHRIARKRARAQRPLGRLYERLTGDGLLRRRIDRVLDRVERGPIEVGAVRPFQRWARRRLAATVAAFFDASPGVEGGEAALHAFRIRGKQLRYSMELLAGAFPPGLMTDVYPVIEEAQDRLGEFTDHAAARDRLAGRRGRSPEVNALFELEAARAARAVREFAAWWEPRRDELHASLAALMTVSGNDTLARNGTPAQARSPGESCQRPA